MAHIGQEGPAMAKAKAISRVISSLPTLADMAAARRGRSNPKGQTRLERTVAQRPVTKGAEQTFRKTVIDRDGYVCRCCTRKVIATMARVPERLEVHHIHGRTGDLRFDPRAALVTCASCHEKLTGKVNQHRLVLLATHTFTTTRGTFTNAYFPVVIKASSKIRD